MPALCLVRALRLYTADDTIASCICQRHASVAQCRDNYFIIVHSRNAQSETGHFTCSVEEFIRCILVNADGEGRRRQSYVGNSFHTHIGYIVGCVQAILCLSAYDQVLEYCVSGKCLCADLITCLVDII